MVAHKIAPAIATNNRVVLKPTELTPLTALLLADVLYEAGLPPEMLSVVTGLPAEIGDEMIVNPNIDLITFTGSVGVGKYIAAKAGYRRMVLELGGNDPLIVMEDADTRQGGGTRGRGRHQEFRPALHGGQAHHRRREGRGRVRSGRAGQGEEAQGRRPGRPGRSMSAPSSPRAPPRCSSAGSNDAVAKGRQASARQQPRGRALPADRRRPCAVRLRAGARGDVRPGHPDHPRCKDINDAIRISNSTAFGLSSGVCTNRLDYITRFINELDVGTVNIWEVPGYRIEMSPFGGIKDSGLGYKEGVVEAMKSFTNVKTYSLPWPG